MAVKHLNVATESCWLLRGSSRSGSIVPAFGLLDDYFSVKQFLSAQSGGTVIPIANDKLPQKTPHFMHALGNLMLSTDNILRLALFSKTWIFPSLMITDKVPKLRHYNYLEFIKWTRALYLQPLLHLQLLSH